QSTVEYVAEELRGAIMAGRLQQGEQLGETELAERLDVSRGPLREAMQRLVAEGLLEAIRNRGVFVTELSTTDVEDIYRTRSAIERGALELVMDGRREDTVGALRPSIIAMRTAARRDSAPGVSDADHRLHEELVADRKSTRLNSSHVSISYAVFCLKKKKSDEYRIYIIQYLTQLITTHLT